MADAMRGGLTAAQLEILEAVWEAGAAGATVATIHAALRRRRPVARTTVLTLVRRLIGDHIRVEVVGADGELWVNADRSLGSRGVPWAWRTSGWRGR